MTLKEKVSEKYDLLDSVHSIMETQVQDWLKWTNFGHKCDYHILRIRALFANKVVSAIHFHIISLILGTSENNIIMLLAHMVMEGYEIEYADWDNEAIIQITK